MIKELIPTHFSNIALSTTEIINTPERVLSVTGFLQNVIKKLVISSCGAIGQVCIIVCGLSIMWFIINNKSTIAKEGFTGSIMVYIGTKLIEIVFK